MIENKYVPPPAVPQQAMSRDTTIHYSFDMAQQVSMKVYVMLLTVLQVHYPSDPLQPGPVYFLTPHKCAIFGVACEGLPRQVIFSIK